VGQDFSAGPVTYTVTAEDGSTEAWTVTVAYGLGNINDISDYIDDLVSGDDSAGTTSNPIPLAVIINLADSSGNGWADLLSVLQTENKYVALDLSVCTMSGTEFDPGSANTGEGKIVSLILPDGALTIKAGADYSNPTFKNFTGLTSVSGEHVTTVGDFAFFSCDALETVSLPVVTSIGGHAFYDCRALETVSLPVVTSIGGHAFYGCRALETVSVLAVTSIGDYAFAYCDALETVSLPVATSIGDYAFFSCDALETVSLPASLTSIGSNPFGNCRNLTGIIVDAANPSYKVEDGKLLSKDGATLIAYPSASGQITLDGVTTIGADAFSYCYALETVSLPAVTSIGTEAFLGCDALETVSLPVATSIGDYAFFSCDALETVSLPVATSIGDSAFAYTGTQELTVTLGNTVPTLGYKMFELVDETKNVTVKVPFGATAWSGKTGAFTGTDSAVNWGNGFRGGGWNGSAFAANGVVNSNIDLTVETYTPAP
jgi:hypothetical protein